MATTNCFKHFYFNRLPYLWKNSSVGNKLHHHGLRFSGFTHWYQLKGKSDCLHANRNVAHRNLLSITRPFLPCPWYWKLGEVFNTNATLTETVTNPKFDQIPQLLSKATNKNPAIITSVRKSTTTGHLQIGKQYIVDSTDKEGGRIHYEHGEMVIYQFHLT